MNKDSDITRDILLRLLFDPAEKASSPSGDIGPPTRPAEGQPGEVNRSPAAADSSGLEPSTVTNPEHLDAIDDLDPVTDSGDVTVVQTHFEALLKRRLRQEIEPRPPLFPWEKTLQDYPDSLNQEVHSSASWLTHLQNLDIPTSLPDDVLAQLFEQCQQVAQHTRQKGRRLVEAVEGLFPDQPQTLENIATLVARPAYRSSQAPALSTIDYGTASSQQQVALSMMAAQSIFDALYLEISATRPTMQRQWLTPSGTLEVTATYSPGEVPRLFVAVQVPEAATLSLTSSDGTITSSRTSAGELVAKVNHPQGQVPYCLDITLDATATCPLRFQVLVGQD